MTAQLDLLGLLTTIGDDQGDDKTPQGRQEAQGDADAVSPAPYNPRPAWQGYTTDTGDDEARRLFVARHGRPPARVWRDRGLVLAGPL